MEIKRFTATIRIKAGVYAVLHRCRGKHCDPNRDTKDRPCRSWTEAKSRGWVYTQEKEYCHDEPGCWICPDCVEHHIEREVSRHKKSRSKDEAAYKCDGSQ